MVLRKIAGSLLVCAGAAAIAPVQAGVVFGNSAGQLTGGIFRWDAAPLTIGAALNERSLDGGLRYAMSGVSYQGFRDQFSWSGAAPSVLDFTTTVQNAFAAWASPDPVSGLASGLSFAYDPGTAVAGRDGAGGANSNGAEIDLIATTTARFWDAGNNNPQGESWFNGISSTVTLTSGVTSYTHSRAISGADIYLNSNPGASYTLDFFGRLLTHEIGHALGFGDIEGDINLDFIGDNFDNSTPASTAASMNNSWAALVNPFDPSNSPGLAVYRIGSASQVAGVDVLMESRGLGISAANPLTRLVPLTNDEYGTRQFLYPMLAVPEPATQALGGLGLLAVLALARRRARTAQAG